MQGGIFTTLAVVADDTKPSGGPWWQLSGDRVEHIAGHAAGAIAILVIAWLFAKWLKRLVGKALERTDVDVTLEKFIARSIGWVVMALGLLAALATAGVEVTAFIAIFSTAGLAIGLAMQGSLSHVASGVMLLLLRPFNVGDSVNIAGREGVVNAIDLFTTTIDTTDNRRVIIPNGAVFGAVIENYSYHGTRLCQMKANIAPGTDPDAARAALLQAARRVIDAGIGAQPTPAPAAVLIEGSGGGVQVWRLNVWAETKKQPAVQERMLEEVDRALGTAKMAAPPPQRVLQVTA